MVNFKSTTVQEVLSKIQSYQRVFVHGGVATPALLIEELEKQANRLRQVELIHLHTFGPANYAAPQFKESFRVTNLFVGANMRSSIDLERVDYIPCFLSEIPQLFRSRRRPLDAALIHVSPPDHHGYCSLGTNVDIAKAAVEVAPLIIAQNPKVTAINSAVEIDLTGQACSNSVGHRVISGVGGQMNFIRGASLSQRGKPILALKSRASNGKSKIVSTLKLGGGVVTTRAHIHYVVTEYGIADLYGKTISERSKALINIAHPDDRENLSRSWREFS